ncbi:hypothetical protein [Nocardia sp. NBC_01327]|uniref:hypothetical protein n=1 Tax=Nocardia sp. NBC_01327 TaxID=2903593 RepID=UPI002E14468A|nr:hypothetical protein OG326_23650 [Nocardia sp. NBC_01327]
MSRAEDMRHAYWEGVQSATDPGASNPYAGADETSPNYRLAQLWAKGRETRIDELIGTDDERP